ncbi:MAG: deoxyribodipyrimidine photo-lyase [Bacteroidetes bacterium]|nr:deoxyribodipyrimidine photo-lyase [Bacteroidota bacterium]
MSSGGTIWFWHRRDLRIADNAGLYAALKDAQSCGARVQPVFIFDRHLLDGLLRRDRRVSFIHHSLEELQAAYAAQGATLWVHDGTPADFWQAQLAAGNVQGIYANEDYEPYARSRDTAVAKLAQEAGVRCSLLKDHVIFARDEVLTQARVPYTVFTPYSRSWLARLDAFYLKPYPVEQYLGALARAEPRPVPSLGTIGFDPHPADWPGPQVPDDLLRHYGRTRDFPGQPGTSRLGVHLRFGTLSIRRVASLAQELSSSFLNELIWRDFYQMILWHFPHVVHQAFKPAYDRIPWRDSPEDFARWCAGETGYPLVDAGMRELTATGYMHNRVRMVVASFLTKHLLIDWRLGEAWFAGQLLDFELASNNGGWQWAAGSGCDAAPYFRIFNPESQLQKFDPQLVYVRRWVPEYGTHRYPQPMVPHAAARQRALDVYKAALNAL